MALTDNLVAYYRLDETGATPGNALDAVGLNDLTENGIIDAATGKVDGARDFELSAGAHTYFSHADNADLSTGDIDFTVAVWVNPESLDAFQTVANKGWQASGSADREWIIFYDTTASRFTFTVGSGTSSVSAVANNLGAASPGTWYYIVAWHDSVNNEIGISVNNGTPDTAAHTGGVNDGSGVFEIGACSAQGLWWDGLEDEFGFWKRVLTSQERTDLYNSGSGLSYDSFAGGGGTTLTAGTGSFTETGQTVTLTAARKLAATAASFSLTGQTVALTGPGAKTLTAEAGSFSLTGQAVNFELAVEAGIASYTLTGQTVGLKVGRKIAPAAGSFSLTGQSVTLTESISYTLSAAAASFALTGQRVSFSTTASPWQAVPAASGTWTPVN